MQKLWNYFNDIFGNTLLHPQYFLKSFEKQAVAELEKRAKGIFVDIGCGRQIYKKQIVGHVKKYIGVDHPQASKKYKDKEMPDVFADAEALPFKNHYADSASMISVLEHIPHPDKALKEAYRILKKNGVFVLITVQAYPLHDAPYDFFRYTKYGLKTLMEDQGFKIVSSRPLGSFPIYVGQLTNVYLLHQAKKAKILGILILPFILAFALLSNTISLLLSGIFTDYEKGAFAIYNLVIAKK